MAARLGQRGLGVEAVLRVHLGRDTRPGMMRRISRPKPTASRIMNASVRASGRSAAVAASASAASTSWPVLRRLRRLQQQRRVGGRILRPVGADGLDVAGVGHDDGVSLECIEQGHADDFTSGSGLAARDRNHAALSHAAHRPRCPTRRPWSTDRTPAVDSPYHETAVTGCLEAARRASRPDARRAPAHAVRARSRARFDKFSHRIDDLLVDCSKQRITEETVRLLVELAAATGVEALRDRMFAGEPINDTEQRAVLHIALRRPGSQPLAVGGRDVMPEVAAARAHVLAFSTAVRSGTWTGAGGATHRRRRQPRHRRLRPRAGDGHRSADAVRPRGPADALRLQRRRRAPRRDAAGRRSGLDAVHRRLQDLHHAGDDGQRALRRAPGWSTRWARPPSAAISWRYPPTPPKCGASASRPTTCSCSGTGSAAATRCGRRSGCRSPSPSAADHFDGAPGRRPRHRRALPIGGRRAQRADAARADRRVERQPARRPHPCRAALRPAAAAGCRPTCSSSTWRATARASPATARRWTSRPGRSCGASPAPTASTPSTS